MCDLEDWHESKHNPAVDKSIEWHLNRGGTRLVKLSAVMETLMKKHGLTSVEAIDALDHYSEHQEQK